jgi:hypothetical protein
VEVNAIDGFDLPNLPLDDESFFDGEVNFKIFDL